MFWQYGSCCTLEHIIFKIYQWLLKYVQTVTLMEGPIFPRSVEMWCWAACWCYMADRSWPQSCEWVAQFPPLLKLHCEETTLIWDCITLFQPTLLISAQQVLKTKQKLFTGAKKSEETERWFHCDKRKLKCNFSPRSFSIQRLTSLPTETKAGLR